MKKKLLRTLVLSAGSLALLGLFALSGCGEEAHSHIFEEEVIRTADCTNAERVELTCTECGYSKIETLDALGHDFGEWQTEIEPTCVKEGVEKRVCRRDTSHVERRKIERAEHSYSEWEIEKAPACLEDGKERRTCIVCKKVQIRTVPSTGHDWGSWSVVKQPACLQDGEEIRTCTVCKKEQTRSVPSTGHDWGIWSIVKEPTCLEAGERQRVCLNCGDSQESPIDLLSHEWGKWTVIKQPTCSEKGEQHRLCLNCGSEEKGPIDFLPHEWGPWTVMIEPTCTREGKQQRLCLNCGSGETSPVEALGHDFGEWEIVTPSDTVHEGEKRRNCTRCDEYLSERLPLLDHEHTYRENVGTRLRQATCLYTGIFQMECATCGEKGEIVYEPVLSHTYIDGVCKNCGRRDWTAADRNDPDLYSSDFAFKSFLETENGAQMQDLYLEIDEKAREYHGGASNASVLGEFEWSGLSKEEAISVWKGYLDDHPLYYWLARELSVPDQDRYAIPVAKEYTNPDVRHELNEMIVKQADGWRKSAPDNAYLATLAYHDLILDRVDYLDRRVVPKDPIWAHNIVGVFGEQGAVCEGFARSFQLMLNMTGIENIFVTGTSEEENHAYNLVRLDDGKWYWYDLTFDDNPGFMWGINYNYFAVSEHQNTQWSDAGWGSSAHREFLDNHTSDNGVGVHFLGALPECAEEPYEGFGEVLVRQTFTEGDFTYAVTGFQTVQLTFARLEDGADVKVPETVTHDGMTYTVISVGSIRNGEFGESGDPVFGINLLSRVGTVYFPATIKFLWREAFEGQIKAYDVAEDNPYFKAQDGVLFTKNMYTLISLPSAGEREEYAIPDGVHVLADEMLSNYNYILKKLTVGKDVELWGLTNWGSGWPDDGSRGGNILGGFWGDLTLFPELETLEVHPGNKCLKIEEDSLLSFNGENYYACMPNAVEAVIPASVKRIQSYAFFSRSDLEKIIFKGTAIERIDNAFGNNYTFRKTGEIVYPGTRAEWDRIKIDDDREDLKNVKITCLQD